MWVDAEFNLGTYKLYKKIEVGVGVGVDHNLLKTPDVTQSHGAKERRGLQKMTELLTDKSFDVVGSFLS